ncbi:putative porin [Pedobacter sp. SYP-B3415]|uniref:putative porin n=1 Tax=Pedobacter sp. SYP-B3415 TaxID=2496641 RepID=UPI00101D9419|nr:putative porin [Pedobacter sp. SYP-B3415]
MPTVFRLLLVLVLSLSFVRLHAQDLKTNINKNKEMDSLRNKIDGAQDSVIFTSKFIRYTNLRLLRDSIQTLPLDTTLRNFQYSSVLIQPERPTANLGNLGLAAIPLLFEHRKTIGFDAGFHSLDWYKVGPEDITYYVARTPFTRLYYVSAGLKEQVFQVTHSQNVTKNWNVGATYDRIGANGFYAQQRGDHLNATLFSWYRSPNKRYNLWVNAIFNTLKASENGSTRNDSIFTAPPTVSLTREAEEVRLRASRQIYRNSTFFLRQSYFVGRIDSLVQDSVQKILPTNKLTYTLSYNRNSYAFQKDEADDFSVLPEGSYDRVFTNDSVSVKHLQNEFNYGFFLRARGSSIIKNELKLNAGLRVDYYTFTQGSYGESGGQYNGYGTNFLNSTLLGNAGYRFSNRIDLNVDLQQIFQGRNAGDFLYEAKSNVLIGKSAGRIVLGAYLQNKSPEEVYNTFLGNHYSWRNNGFERTKIANLSFQYLNDKYNFKATADYYLISNYLYFERGAFVNGFISPQQAAQDINLLKITASKKVTFGKFNLDLFIAYQKNSNENVLRTPEFYTFNSLYLNQTLFKVLKTNLGFDVRYNTAYRAYSYTPGISQFYIGPDVTFSTYPIVDVFLKANLKRANLFVKYDYANQKLFTNGFYTVNRYPMQDALLKFGVSWNFYD